MPHSCTLARERILPYKEWREHRGRRGEGDILSRWTTSNETVEANNLTEIHDLYTLLEMIALEQDMIHSRTTAEDHHSN